MNKTLAVHLAEKCEENKPDAVQLLIAACGKDPSSINAYCASSNGRRETPLHICARIDAWICAKHLLESGACDMLLWNNEGKTALRVARDNKSVRTTELLENFPLNRLGAQGGLYNQQVDTPLIAPLPHTFQLRGGGSQQADVRTAPTRQAAPGGSAAGTPPASEAPSAATAPLPSPPEAA